MRLPEKYPKPSPDFYAPGDLPYAEDEPDPAEPAGPRTRRAGGDKGRANRFARCGAGLHSRTTHDEHVRRILVPRATTAV